MGGPPVPRKIGAAESEERGSWETIMQNAFLREAKSVLNRIPARSKITVGLGCLLVGVLLLAMAAGLVPNETQAIMAGRAKFCEAVAVHCSVLVARGDIDSLRGSFGPLISRDRDILSAAIRAADGSVLAELGDHAKEWSNGAGPVDSNIYVPIWTNDKKWGAVEMRFRPLGKPGLIGQIEEPAGAPDHVCGMRVYGGLSRLSPQDASASGPVQGRAAARSFRTGYAGGRTIGHR